MVAYNRPQRRFQDGLAIDANDFNAFRADLLSDMTRLVQNLVGTGGPALGSFTADSISFTADSISITADAA